MLLRVLQERAAALGVELLYRREVPGPATSGRHLMLAADGING